MKLFIGYPIITLVLSYPVSEILELLRRKPLLPTPSLIPANISVCSLWNRPMILESANSDYLRMTDSEIIFEEFQPINI